LEFEGRVARDSGFGQVGSKIRQPKVLADDFGIIVCGSGKFFNARLLAIREPIKPSVCSDDK
jgi:hypothetical protein